MAGSPVKLTKSLTEGETARRCLPGIQRPEDLASPFDVAASPGHFTEAREAGAEGLQLCPRPGRKHCVNKQVSYTRQSKVYVHKPLSAACRDPPDSATVLHNSGHLTGEKRPGLFQTLALVLKLCMMPFEEFSDLVRGFWDAINGNPSWHLVDSPMESGAPGHNRSLDAPEAIPMAAVKQVLREAGEKSELRYQQAFSDMASKLHLTLETAHQTFEQAVNELFRDEVSWGRIVAFFSFGGTLCVENIDKEMQALVSQIPSWMATYLIDHLETWIQDNGGWDTFVELHGNNVAVNSWKGQEHFNLCFLMGMIVAGVVLLGWLFSRR
ncbi:LOW QUALITY PROTEIN: bcl-2-like protein 1 [Marmota monax]|uniref:LOW QUALITY PROTEIN: bcl-2-like protein 1 n=1 Tax=Marmota monax TaxID=9995 RepID=UPI001EB00AC4|nr:LOW QUALITY PROTEIN: bcl-2-like protein 1 [Marmota monax]